jgi:hypothetical protein
MSLSAQLPLLVGPLLGDLRLLMGTGSREHLKPGFGRVEGVHCPDCQFPLFTPSTPFGRYEIEIQARAMNDEYTYALAKTAPSAPARADPTGVNGGRAGGDI